jgi:hypothetical protein
MFKLLLLALAASLVAFPKAAQAADSIALGTTTSIEATRTRLFSKFALEKAKETRSAEGRKQVIYRTTGDLTDKILLSIETQGDQDTVLSLHAWIQKDLLKTTIGDRQAREFVATLVQTGLPQSVERDNLLKELGNNGDSKPSQNLDETLAMRQRPFVEIGPHLVFYRSRQAQGNTPAALSFSIGLSRLIRKP